MMKKIKLFLVATFVSLIAFAQISTTIIQGVQRDRLEEALRRKMDVHAVSILEMKERKFENLVDDIFSIFDRSKQETTRYTFTMRVDESIFNNQEHTVKCDVIDNQNDNDLFFLNCESKTSSVQNMLFSKTNLR